MVHGGAKKVKKKTKQDIHLPHACLATKNLSYLQFQLLFLLQPL